MARWTPEQDAILRRMWGKATGEEIGNAVGGKSRLAVGHRARSIGLPLLAPGHNFGGPRKGGKLRPQLRPPPATPVVERDPPPLPTPAMIRLAEFDEVVKRAMHERLAIRALSAETA